MKIILILLAILVPITAGMIGYEVGDSRGDSTACEEMYPPRPETVYVHTWLYESFIEINTGQYGLMNKVIHFYVWPNGSITVNGTDEPPERWVEWSAGLAPRIIKLHSFHIGFSTLIGIPVTFRMRGMR